MKGNDKGTIGDNFQSYYRSVLRESNLGDDCIVGDFSRIYHCNLSNNVRVDRNNFLLHTRMGDYSYTGQFTVIMHSEIGKFCSISWGVTIGAGEHDYNKLTTHDFLYNKQYELNKGDISYDRFEKPLKIGSDVWIGANATVIRGVCIGNGAVVGANSVVTKDVPPYAIVAGCPARIVKYRFSEKIISRLEQLEWWDLPPQVIKDSFELFSSNDIDLAIQKLEMEKVI